MKQVARIAMTCAVLITAACSDDGTNPRPDPTEPPDGFALEAQDTVLQGRPFSVTVTALDVAGLPESDWSGPVTLHASAGSFSPSTLQLQGGSVTAEVTLSGGAGVVALRVASGSIESEPVLTMVLSGEPAARIEIVPSAALLTGAGESQAFAARVYDAAGAPTSAQVTWTTNDPATLAIDDAGLATAQALGSALVTATADGVASQPALALVAQPAGDPVLLTDEQILTEPEAVDPLAAYETGWQYRVRVRNADVQVNDVVIGTGARPLAGRVVAISDAGNGETELTVALVALTELFTDLRIDESIPLVEMDAAEFRPAGVNDGADMPAGFAVARVDTFPLGPFRCTYDVTLPSLDIDPADTNIDPDLSLDIGYYNGELSRFVVVGQLIGTAEYRPVVKGEFSASTTCETPPRVFTVPLGGPAAFVFGLQLPIGVGFELEGEVKIAEIGFDISASATASAQLGISCTAAGMCSGVQEFDVTRDWDFEFVSPDPEEDFRVQLAAHGYLYGRPYIGSRFTQRVSFELIDAKAGLQQSVNLATTLGQASDTAYASSFDLQFLATIGPGAGMRQAVETLGNLIGVDLSAAMEPKTHADTLASSPTGTFTITPPQVAPGDSTQLGEMAMFEVDLEKVDYLGVPSVDKVEFFWKQAADDGSFTLVPGRPSCTEIPADDGQTTFDCETDFLTEHRGEQTFYAFVHAELFGVPLPVPLEVAVDGQARVAVTAQCAAPPADLVPELLVYSDTSAAGDDVLEGLSYSADPHEFGNITLTASATNEANGGSTARMNTSAVSNDWVLVTPADPSRIGERVHVRFWIEGVLEADAHSSGYESVSASAGYRMGGGTGSRSVSDTTDLSYEQRGSGYVQLGTWEPFITSARTTIEKYRTSRGTARASASIRISQLPMEFVNALGEPLEATLCTASGHTY